MNVAEIAPIRFHIGPTGPGPGTLMGEPLAPGSTTGEEAMAKMRVASGLFPLPGRQVRLGESWSDTSSRSDTVQGMKVDKQQKTSGTYVADTVIDGRTLNILRVIIESASTTSGTHQGTDVTQTTTEKTEELVLWDSARHIPVSRRSIIHIDMTTEIRQMNVTTRYIATSRNIITGEAQD